MAMAINALSPHNVFLSLPNHHTHSCARSFSSASASSSSSFHIASAPRALCRSVSCIDSASYDPSLLRRPHELKLSLRESLQGVNHVPCIQFPKPKFLATSIRSQCINRGIFGVSVIQKTEIEQLIQLLEIQNPTSSPMEHLDKMKGEWKLLYSTVSILGSRRTKLGLRDFITLGDFIQVIDVEKSRAKNIVTFTVAGLGMLSGALTIEASYVVSSTSRVDIRFEKSSIVPDQLFKLFQKNYDLLLSVFNPQGWLEITYLDGDTRVGRDEKGNIFLLERFTKESDV